MGVFAEWQPAYAEAGVATFPVDGIEKRPVVGNYLKAGRRASAQWALKFPEVNAFGFACGEGNRLTVLDVDTSDERVLADAMSQLGASPVVIRTASGKFHAWYRHNGEPRKIRAAQFNGPVDILGGGFAVAPPSQGSLSNYKFLQGSLADISNLPIMKPLDAVAHDGGSTSSILAKAEGERNNTLWRDCMSAAPQCGSQENLLRFARALNDSGDWCPLPDDEVQRAVGSAWRCQVEGRNGFAGDRFVQIDRTAHDALRDSPDAVYLYQLLRAEHWGRDFCITNSWADSLPLSLARLQDARRILLKRKLIECVCPQRRGSAAIFRFLPPNDPIGGRRGEGV